jgi:hypothetical protein
MTPLISYGLKQTPALINLGWNHINPKETIYMQIITCCRLILITAFLLGGGGIRHGEPFGVWGTYAPTPSLVTPLGTAVA